MNGEGFEQPDYWLADWSRRGNSPSNNAVEAGGKLGGSIRLAVTSFGPCWFSHNRLWAQFPLESLVDNLTKLSQDKWVMGRRRQEGSERERLDFSVNDVLMEDVYSRERQCLQVPPGRWEDCLWLYLQTEHRLCQRVSVLLCLLGNLIALLRGRFAKTEHSVLKRHQQTHGNLRQRSAFKMDNIDRPKQADPPYQPTWWTI